MSILSIYLQFQQNMLLMTEQSSPRPVVDESNMTMEVSETQSLHPGIP